MANTLFVPARKIITAITNTFPALVTVSENHDYITGDIIRIYVPGDHGMNQIDQQFAPIEVLNALQFYIDIDARSYAPFVIPVPERQYAQSVAIGEINELLEGAVHNSLNTSTLR